MGIMGVVMFSVEKNETDIFKLKYVLMMQNKPIAYFSNRKQALKIMRFLSWYENRFGKFVDMQQAANQVHRSIKNAKLKINFETIY